MEKKIEIRHGDVYCTKISSIYNEDDFFHEAYRKAAQGVRDIVEATEHFHDEVREKRPGRSSPDVVSGVTEYMHLAGYPNNIIAFCAGRGQGKTSAMVSFSTALRQRKGDEQEQRFWGDLIKTCSFHVLDPIDPTMMNQGDSILRIIISRMFECYTNEEKKQREFRNGRPEKEPELLNGFRQCYRSLDVLQKGRDLQDCYDDLEYLADLGDSSNLKKTFQKLVSLFLDLVIQHAVGESHQFLIIQIDDADLNAANAYRIVEELRRYCVVPNVLILMATDFGQLELTVEQHFIEELKTLCTHKKDDKAVWDHCHKMMERYLDKLIPGTRQVHLPLIDHYIKGHENELLLKYTDGNLKVWDGDYQDLLLKMIYQKTGLILVKPTGYLHNLLPKTMRELTHLLAFLSELEELDFENCALLKLIQMWQKTSKNRSLFRRQNALPAADILQAFPQPSRKSLEALELRRKNVDALMLYLRHCWTKAALSEDQQSVIVPVTEATVGLKIKQLLFGLRAYGAKKYPDTWNNQNCCDGFQYADVITTLNALKAQPNCTDEFPLIYISATILTLYMHLLVMQDLTEGLHFKRLKDFMGGSIFPPETGRFQWRGQRYDHLNIDNNLISKVVGLNLSAANPGTRTVARLLLTEPEDHTGGQARIFSGRILLGSQAAILKVFNNCLDRTAPDQDPTITAELLDIILSWDLQYHISKQLNQNNRGTENEPSRYYETWVLQQFEIMDNIYKRALINLNIDAAFPILEDTFEKEQLLLAAFALGNQDYAEQWWDEIKARMKMDLLDIENTLRQIKEDDSESAQIRLLQYCVPKLRTLGRSGNRGYVVSMDKLLSNPALFHNGTTPQDIIDHAAELLRLPPESKSWDKSDENQETTFWQKKIQDIDLLLEQVKKCQTDLDSVRLYFQPGKRRAEKIKALQESQGSPTPLPSQTPKARKNHVLPRRTRQRYKPSRPYRPKNR